jgi:hypothetical protein
MYLVLSLVSLLVLVGHAVAMARFRSFWPFDHYPMYSFPVSRMRYPIVRGRHLTMFSVLEVSDDGTTTDLLGGPRLYPAAFHPLDRIEILVMLVRAGMLEGIDHELGSKQIEGEMAGTLRQALSDLLALGRANRPQLRTLRLVAMEWSDFRDPQSDVRHPERCRVVTEVSHS